MTIATEEEQSFISHEEAEECFFTSIMPYQGAQLLCELMTPTF